MTLPGPRGMGFCATFFTTAKTRSWVVIQADFNMHSPVASLDVEKSSRIFVAGHRGLVGSAITRRLQLEGYQNLILPSRAGELDLRNQARVNGFFGALSGPNMCFWLPPRWENSGE